MKKILIVFAAAGLAFAGCNSNNKTDRMEDSAVIDSVLPTDSIIVDTTAVADTSVTDTL